MVEATSHAARAKGERVTVSSEADRQRGTPNPRWLRHPDAEPQAVTRSEPRCSIVRHTRSNALQPVTISVQSWQERPMEESTTIVADPTCRLGNRLHASSGDDALASVTWGPAGGLASHRATTSNGIASSAVRRDHTNGVQVEQMGVPSQSHCGEGNTFGRMDRCARRTPRRTGSGRMTGTEVQSRDDPYPISEAAGTPKANSSHIRGCGSAHEAIVAMMPTITSRMSEGPLGSVAMEGVECLGYSPKGLHDPLKSRATSLWRSPHQTISDGGKGAGDGRTRSLKPDSGNPTFRDFRGDEGNLTILGFRE